MMTGNPLSGHTNHNLAALSGTASAVDGLADGDHIVSPTLTNILEGVHGNGVILEEDTANGATNRSVPENLPGICEQVTNTYTFTVTGGHAVIDGLLYAFAGGPGSSADIDITSSSNHKTGSPSALTSGQEALVVVYVSSDGGDANNIYWELGSPVTAAANTYPSAPSSFLNFPNGSLTVKQSVVLAVLRVVYSSGGGNLKVSITEINDKRAFVRPSPLYFSPVTTGAVGAANAPVDLHTELDNLHGGGDEAGDFTGSRFGALWQTHGSQISSTTAGDNQKDVLYYSATNAARYTRSVFDRILTSTATSIDITSADANILILTPGGSGAVTTSGSFPAGYVIEIGNLHASNDLTFALTNSTTSTVSAGGYGRFVCTVSHASDPTFVRVNDGVLEASEIHITTSGVGDALTIESTADNASTHAPNLILYRNGSDTPLDNELIGEIKFRGENDNTQDVEYATIQGGMDDVSDGTEDGNMTFNIIKAGTLSEFVRLRAGTSQVVINDTQHNIDFRVEGDTADNLLRTDATNYRVGIGTGTPSSSLEIQDGLTTTGAVLTLSTKEPSVVANDVLGQINFQAPLDTGADSDLVGASIQALATGTFSDTVNATDLLLKTGASETATEKMRIKSDGKVGIGTAIPQTLLEIKNLTEDDGPMLRLSGSGQDGANNLIGGIEAHNADSNGDGPTVVTNIKSFSYQGSGQGGYMTFGTHDGSEGGEGSEPVERMRINGAGRVGIGTTSPDSNAALSLEGALSLDEISAPSNTADRGQLYTNADNELHMIDGAGTDTIFLKSGKRTMWIPAAAMYPNTTSGCSALTQVELSNGPELKCLDFDDGATESAQFTVAFPKSWNEGTVTFKAYWCSTATDTDGVSWGLRACGMNDNETINLAFGTQIVVDDANQGAANELMVTAESSAMTIAGTPAAEDLTFFQISRVHDDSNDTAAEDARLLGIKLYYTTDAGNDV